MSAPAQTASEVAERLEALLALREKAQLAVTQPFQPAYASWSIAETFTDYEEDTVANGMSFNVAEFFSEASNQSPDLLRAAASLIRAQSERERMLVEAGTFLAERLTSFENDGDVRTEDGERDWRGHVSPALSRFRKALTKAQP